MNEDPETRRRSIRLKGYDYSQQGAYFVTICVHDRKCLLGTIRDEHMTLSPFGTIVQGCWDGLPGHYLGLQLDAFVVMPNHLHGILLLSDPHFVGAGLNRLLHNSISGTFDSAARPDVSSPLMGEDERWG